MIPANKQPLNREAYSNEAQSGITLMLAVLVLAAITAVAFSLATIVFIEVRSAGDAARTEPALYATLGVTEEALFQYKRVYDPVGGGQMNVPACTPEGVGDGQPNICNINGVTLSMPGVQPIAFDNSPREEFIGAGVTKVIPLYVVNDYVTQQYQDLQVDVLPNQGNQGVILALNAYLVNAIDPEVTRLLEAVPGRPTYTTAFRRDAQFELVIENRSAQDLTVVISTTRYGVPATQPQGLPYVGEQVLRIMASYAGLTRTYQVRIPIP